MISVHGSVINKMITYWSRWWEVNNHRDELARTILTVSIPALVFLWYKWMSFLFYKTSLPPGPYGLPVVGYLPFLSSNLHEKFTEMSHKYGPIFSLHLGSKLHVVVNSADLVKVVARDMDQIFANRNAPIAATVITYGGSDIAWTKSKTHWRNMRKLLVSHVMSNANLNASRSFRTREVRKTVKEVYAKIGQKVNINEIAFNTELNVVTSMLWGCSRSGYDGDGFREVEFKIVELLGAPNISDFLPFLACFDLQKRRRDMQRQLEYVDQIFNNIIETRIKTNSDETVEEDGRKDFLQILLDLKDHKDTPASFNMIQIKALLMAVEEDGRKDFLQILLELKDQKDTPASFNMIQIKALLMDIIVAATDTTSTMVEWVMAEILNNPGVMRMVQDELTKVIGINNIVEESHLRNLTYLDAVIKETFRLHPPLPLLIQRCPDEACKVGGYTIPKDTIVYMNVWAIHRDPDNWTHPLEFKPERFLNGTWDYKGNNVKFLPFGLGRRICPGIPLGDKMLTYILASLLHSFAWNLPKDVEFDLSDEFGFVTKKRISLVSIPSQRLSDATLYTG